MGHLCSLGSADSLFASDMIVAITPLCIFPAEKSPPAYQKKSAAAADCFILLSLKGSTHEWANARIVREMRGAAIILSFIKAEINDLLRGQISALFCPQ